MSGSSHTPLSTLMLICIYNITSYNLFIFLAYFLLVFPYDILHGTSLYHATARGHAIFSLDFDRSVSGRSGHTPTFT